MYYCIKNVNETRTLKTSIVNIETIILNERGDQGSYLKLYNTASTPTDDNLVAEIKIADCDNLLQYVPSGLELENGLTYTTSGNPGNITIVYR